MSINPFSSNEIKTLREFIEKNGWKIEKHIEYEIMDLCVILLTPFRLIFVRYPLIVRRQSD